jgi:NhaA family Na+:H+ antiporter
MANPLADARRPPSMLRAFLDNSASGGLVLMGAAALALLVANSPLAPSYFAALHAYLGPLSVAHWINDALMAVFFLFVGLEIKREMLDGQLSTWSRRILPGTAAAGGMAVPAPIYLAFNWGDPATVRGWAIPSATDIAFALGVLALLGSRVPTSLKVFLTALAIIDDLGAVVIIALFYTGDLSTLNLLLTAGVTAVLIALNRLGVVRLAPYLLLGAVLWFLVLRSGVHATVAGVVLALTIPLTSSPAPRTRRARLCIG